MTVKANVVITRTQPTPPPVESVVLTLTPVQYQAICELVLWSFTHVTWATGKVTITPVRLGDQVLAELGESAARVIRSRDLSDLYHLVRDNPV